MAFAARTDKLPTEENAILGMKNVKASLGKGPSLLEQGSKRRAPLSDVSNLNGTLGNRGGLAKDGTMGKDGKAIDSKADLIPRTRSQTAAAARQQTGGLSMSSLLDGRSDACNLPSVTSAQMPSSPMPDIDSVDSGNSLAEVQYVNDIFKYLMRVEPKFRVAADYMTRQTDINIKMRSILVDWLVEVQLKFKLWPETLFLAVNLIDRYLEGQQVTRKNLQLVGVSAMLIASKYEEIFAAEVKDFVYISDRAYTPQQILHMEKTMLNKLKFNLTVPTPYTFQNRFLKAAGATQDKEATMLTSYLLELSLVDANMLQFSYSNTTAAAVHVALTALGRAETYPRALAKHSGHNREAVMDCSAALVAAMQKAPTASLSAVYKKYSHVKYIEIAKTPAPMQML
eukprot:gene1038-3902_t